MRCERIDCKWVVVKCVKECVEGVVVMKRKVGVRMGIVNGKNEVVNKGEGRGIRKEVVVCRVWMIVVSVYEVMVEMKMIDVRVFEVRRWKDRIEE